MTPLTTRKRLKQAKGASRVKAALAHLNRVGIKFDSRNNGQHLIVEGIDCFIDFWPSTDRWNTRFGFKSRGLYRLIKYAHMGGEE